MTSASVHFLATLTGRGGGGWREKQNNHKVLVCACVVKQGKNMPEKFLNGPTTMGGAGARRDGAEQAQSKPVQE